MHRGLWFLVVGMSLAVCGWVSLVAWNVGQADEADNKAANVSKIRPQDRKSTTRRPAEYSRHHAR